MPLDTGSVTSMLRLAEPFARGPGPDASAYATLGAYLQAVREHRSLSLAQVADLTRVRRTYLEALERDDLTPLPSRPFAVGYVRAYARALGLDGDAAVARFKIEKPEDAPKLRAPAGVQTDKDSRRQVIYAGAALLLIAIGLWNIAQRTLIGAAASPPILAPGAPAWPAPRIDAKALTLSAPTPPPADQTTPKPYVTPGLGVAGIDKNAPAVGDSTNASPGASEPAAIASDPAPPAKFSSRAVVYGAPAKDGGVLVQARSPASLIVRGPAGQIYFARELEAGEAYRAPLGRGLTADVSDPTAFAIYAGGRYAGGLSDPQTSIDKAALGAAQPTQPPTSSSTTPTVASAR
jgi:cytoskeleton protein RodZ